MLWWQIQYIRYRWPYQICHLPHWGIGDCAFIIYWTREITVCESSVGIRGDRKSIHSLIVVQPRGGSAADREFCGDWQGQTDMCGGEGEKLGIRCGAPGNICNSVPLDSLEMLLQQDCQFFQWKTPGVGPLFASLDAVLRENFILYLTEGKI